MIYAGFAFSRNPRLFRHSLQFLANTFAFLIFVLSVLTHDHLSLEFRNITNNGNTETTNSISTVTYSKSDYGIEYVPYSNDILIRNTIEYLQYSD